MKKWEYLIVTHRADVHVAESSAGVIAKASLPIKLFEQLGNEGWELVMQANDHAFYFKRPKK